MKTQVLESLIALLEVPGMGRKKTKSLLDHLPDFETITLSDLVELGIKQRLISQSPSKKTLQGCSQRAKEILEKNDRYGIQTVSIFDDDYPIAFNFDDAPLILYYLGSRDCLDQRQRVAIIGSRRPTKAGYEFAFSMGRTLARQKAVIVSGLAVGCDSAGHRGCLSVNGQTIAFLPSGLLSIYPFENRYLAEEILEKKGCLLSEYPLDRPPKPFHFIERDRLQAGVSDYLVVSTFSKTGGSLHTLKYAKQYLKEIVTSQEIIDQCPSSFLKLSDLGISYKVLDF